MRLFPLLPLLYLAACGGGGSGTSDPPPKSVPEPDPFSVSIGLQPAFPRLSFEAPMAMVQPPNDSGVWYLAERAGRVWRFEANDTVDRAFLVVDISARVSTESEGGLLGIAFHPRFADNGRVYLSYTAPLTPLESRLSEFLSLDNGSTFELNSERIVLSVLQDAGNHNGGHILFGPDGMLYVGMGDGGGANDPLGRAQDTTNLLGTVLRIDVDGGQPYGIPGDNPFAANPPCIQGFGSADCPEIYAWGLRNPWRFSFDRTNGELWLGDVGQDDWEEIDVVRADTNYGWPIREGAHCNPNLFSGSCNFAGTANPVAEYDHNLGQSITGGYVYRGAGIANLSGAYVFGDFVNGRIWRLIDGALGLVPDELIDSDLKIVSFAEDAAGELYALDIAGGIFRLIAAAP